MKKIVAQVAVALLISAGAVTFPGLGQAQSARAETAVPAKAGPAATTAGGARTKKPRSAASIECSRQAEICMVNPARNSVSAA